MPAFRQMHQRLLLQQREKLVQYEKDATASRNEYILSLVSSNAYKERYYQTELSGLIDTMDQNFFDTLRSAIQSYADRCTTSGQLVLCTRYHLMSSSFLLQKTHSGILRGRSATAASKCRRRLRKQNSFQSSALCSSNQPTLSSYVTSRTRFSVTQLCVNKA